MLEQNRSLEHTAQLNALRNFARRMAISEKIAVALYEGQVDPLRELARVSRFVGVLAEKRTKDALRTLKRKTSAETPGV